jgi:hypothetical protein
MNHYEFQWFLMLHIFSSMPEFDPHSTCVTVTRPPAEFFELQPFLRSAMLGALIPATAIASGHVLVVQAEVLGKFFLRG